jgi:hypothetical protein
LVISNPSSLSFLYKRSAKGVPNTKGECGKGKFRKKGLFSPKASSRQKFSKNLGCDSIRHKYGVGDHTQTSGITNSNNQTLYLGFVGVDDCRADYQQKGPFQTESEVDEF